MPLSLMASIFAKDNGLHKHFFSDDNPVTDYDSAKVRAEKIQTEIKGLLSYTKEEK